MRVLIVDDNETNRDILHHLFNSWGMREQLAANAAEALTIMHSEADKRKAVRPCRARRANAGHGWPGTGARGEKGSEARLHAARHADLRGSARMTPALLRESGVDGYLTKPVKQLQLFDCLSTVMSSDVETAEIQSGLIVLARTATAASASRSRVESCAF